MPLAAFGPPNVHRSPRLSYKMFIWLLEFVLLFISEQHAATAEKLVKQLHCKHFRKLFQIRPGSPKTCKGGGRIFCRPSYCQPKSVKELKGSDVTQFNYSLFSTVYIPVLNISKMKLVAKMRVNRHNGPFLPHDSMHSTVPVVVRCPSVRLSVTLVHSMKTTKVSSNFLRPGSTIILVFWAHPGDVIQNYKVTPSAGTLNTWEYK